MLEIKIVTKLFIKREQSISALHNCPLVPSTFTLSRWCCFSMSFALTPHHHPHPSPHHMCATPLLRGLFWLANFLLGASLSHWSLPLSRRKAKAQRRPRPKKALLSMLSRTRDWHVWRHSNEREGRRFNQSLWFRRVVLRVCADCADCIRKSRACSGRFCTFVRLSNRNAHMDLQ